METVVEAKYLIVFELETVRFINFFKWRGEGEGRERE
jgi:hypothetical protein